MGRMKHVTSPDWEYRAEYQRQLRLEACGRVEVLEADNLIAWRLVRLLSVIVSGLAVVLIGLLLAYLCKCGSL